MRPAMAKTTCVDSPVMLSDEAASDAALTAKEKIVAKRPVLVPRHMDFVPLEIVGDMIISLISSIVSK